MNRTSTMIDMVGKKFGKLRVISLSHKDNRNEAHWLCECSCGKSKSVSGYYLRSGKTVSCGCHRDSVNRARLKTHGMSGSRIYNSWCHMMGRCYNKNNSKYRSYGGRGIKVAKEWHVFENFYRDMGYQEEGMSIDRIDNSLGYSKNNCRWATPTMQSNNTRTNRLINYGGSNYTMADFSREFDVPYHKIRYRVSRGLSLKPLLKK